jgi:hypothetical protein
MKYVEEMQPTQSSTWLTIGDFHYIMTANTGRNTESKKAKREEEGGHLVCISLWRDGE